MYKESIIKNIIDLISEVSKVKQQYLEKYKIEGKNYNIFKVIRKTSDEVHLHTKLIADLLSPESSHNLGCIPLKLFFENCLKEKKIEVEGDAFRVSREKSVGIGKIDILIESKRVCIAIENKLYAEDQDNQLWRYFQFLKNQETENKKTYLVYLTYHGSEATPKSLVSPKKNAKCLNKNDYIQISYESNILKWLEELEKKIDARVWIQEPLRQYINLIKEAVGKSMSDKEESEILNLIKKNGDVFKSALQIHNSFKRATELIKDEIIKKLKEELYTISKKNPGSIVVNDDDDNWYVKIDNYKYGIWWDAARDSNLYYGVLADSKSELKKLKKILPDCKEHWKSLVVDTQFCYTGEGDEYKSIMGYLDDPSVFQPIIDDLSFIIQSVTTAKSGIKHP